MGYLCHVYRPSSIQSIAALLSHKPPSNHPEGSVRSVKRCGSKYVVQWTGTNEGGLPNSHTRPAYDGVILVQLRFKRPATWGVRGRQNTRGPHAPNQPGAPPTRPNHPTTPPSSINTTLRAGGSRGLHPLLPPPSQLRSPVATPATTPHPHRTAHTNTGACCGPRAQKVASALPIGKSSLSYLSASRSACVAPKGRGAHVSAWTNTCVKQTHKYGRGAHISA